MFRRIFSFARKAVTPLAAVRLLSLPVIYTCLKTYEIKNVAHATSEEHNEVPQSTFKVSEYSNTLYELRKDHDDFIIITNISRYNENLKAVILKILERIHNASEKEGRKLRVMYIQAEDYATEKSLEEANNLKIHKDVIFLLKNKYSEKLETFTLEQLLRNKTGLDLYFQPIVTSDRNDVRKVIEKLDDNEAVLLYVGDDSDRTKLFESEKRFKLAERTVQNEKKNIKFLFVAKEEELTAMGFADTIPDHYHLILKESPQSTTEANLFMNMKNYHIISNIQLYNKDSKLELDDYIDQVHTFSDNSNRYNVVLKIDKNEIDPEKMEEIVTTVRDVKKESNFPDLSFQIEFGAVDSAEYWGLEIVDLERLDQNNDKYIKGVQSLPELVDIGKHTYRYKLESTPTKKNIKEFIQQVIEGRANEYYQSEEPKVVNSLHKITGNTFQKHVRKNDKHHLVFQYSQHCHACKQLAPILVKFNTQNSNHSIETHRLSQQNVIKGQIIYPYSPVLLFYKNEWKPNPIQIPTESLVKESKNLKTYCEILSDIRTIDEQELQKHYFQASNLSWENLPFKLI